MSPLPQSGSPAYYDGDARTLVAVPLEDLSEDELYRRWLRLTSFVLFPSRRETCLSEIADIRRIWSARKAAAS